MRGKDITVFRCVSYKSLTSGLSILSISDKLGVEVEDELDFILRTLQQKLKAH